MTYDVRGFPMSHSHPHVVIIGGGFGGLYAARGLRRARVQVTVIDRANHHLFQPLLYEVATAALSPADIAAPIRTILSRQANTKVLLAKALAVDVNARRVRLADGVIDYDYLILATGATHSYFGRDDWEKFAPGLKTVDDALEIRRRFLLAFEAAEREADPEARRAKLTFVVVGGGPTGVELAGTMSEIARRGIPRDFRSIDTTTARVILIEAQDRLLSTFSAKLSQHAKSALEKLGVEVRLNSRVIGIDEHGVVIGPPEKSERINAESVFWAAGVQASPLGATLDVPMDRQGRVMVQPDLSIANHPEVFVIGDLAKVIDPKSKHEVPGVGPAAIQMGKYVARIIERESTARVRGDTASNRDKPFHFIDKGMLATIGRAKAVGAIKGFEFHGLLAWLLWATVHVFYLIGFRNRLLVMLEWGWAYIMFRRGARLITGDTDLDLRTPRTESSGELEPTDERG